MASVDQVRCTGCFTSYDRHETQRFDHWEENDRVSCPVSRHLFYCRSCIEKLPSPQTCPTCNTALIAETATQRMPTATPSDLPMDPPRIVAVIHTGQQLAQPVVAADRGPSGYIVCVAGTVVVIWFGVLALMCSVILRDLL